MAGGLSRTGLPAHIPPMAKASRPGKLGERSQRHFEPAPQQALDPALAQSLGLNPGDLTVDFESAGASATVQALAKLIETGRPEVNGQTWVPHRPPRPEKSEGGVAFTMKSDFQPAGDQPQAIKELCAQAEAGERDQVLLGVTGSGKTFTMAKVIEQ